MTKTRIQRLRTLCANATRAPWTTWNSTANVGVRSEEDNCRIYYEKLEKGCLPETHDRQRADATFIAEARTALPEALDRIEELEREVERLQEIVDCERGTR